MMCASLAPTRTWPSSPSPPRARCTYLGYEAATTFECASSHLRLIAELSVHYTLPLGTLLERCSRVCRPRNAWRKRPASNTKISESLRTAPRPPPAADPPSSDGVASGSTAPPSSSSSSSACGSSGAMGSAWLGSSTPDRRPRECGLARKTRRATHMFRSRFGFYVQGATRECFCGCLEPPDRRDTSGRASVQHLQISA